jgi:hypothetical protein
LLDPLGPLGLLIFWVWVPPSLEAKLLLIGPSSLQPQLIALRLPLKEPLSELSGRSLEGFKFFDILLCPFVPNFEHPLGLRPVAGLPLLLFLSRGVFLREPWGGPVFILGPSLDP